MNLKKSMAVIIAATMVVSGFVPVSAYADETTDDYSYSDDSSDSGYDYSDDSSDSDYDYSDDSDSSDYDYSSDSDYSVGTDYSTDNGSDYSDDNTADTSGNTDNSGNTGDNTDNSGDNSGDNNDDSDDNDDDDEPKIDYSTIKLAKKSFTLVAKNSWGYYVSGKIKLKGVPKGVDLTDYDITSLKSSNSKKIKAYSYDFYVNSKNYLCYTVYGTGKSTISFKIATKKLSFKINVLTPASLTSRSYILVRGTSKQLKLKGSYKSAKVTYKSLSPSIASVTSKGKVKAKKLGTAVIKVTVKYKNDTVYLGTAVNVASWFKAAVYRWDRSYALKNKYSQPKRMLKGYYDCSSLVWRAFRSKGVRFVNKYYAPTAAELARYLVGKGRKVGSASMTNFQARKFRVGDLLFKTGAKNKRYKGIYHVEMFGGYTFDYFDSKGKPVLALNYANRGDDNYYGVGNSFFICRP